MAQRIKNEVEFIQDTFCPQVAVLCSYDAEVVCRKNSLTFVELVQPFCRYNGESKKFYLILTFKVENRVFNKNIFKLK
jgi:hypothetical protein